MELCEMYENWYPEHSRSSCSDEYPINADVDGSGCHRCNAIRFEQNEERGKRIEALEAEVTDLTDGKAMINKWFQETFKELASAQAENLKLRKALKQITTLPSYDMIADEALSTPSDTTALTEYRDAVLEEAAALAVEWGNARKDNHGGHALRNYAEALRAMKEKP